MPSVAAAFPGIQHCTLETADPVAVYFKISGITVEIDAPRHDTCGFVIETNVVSDYTAFVDVHIYACTVLKLPHGIYADVFFHNTVVSICDDIGVGCVCHIVAPQHGTVGKDSGGTQIINADILNSAIFYAGYPRLITVMRRKTIRGSDSDTASSACVNVTTPDEQRFALQLNAIASRIADFNI